MQGYNYAGSYRPQSYYDAPISFAQSDKTPGNLDQSVSSAHTLNQAKSILSNVLNNMNPQKHMQSSNEHPLMPQSQLSQFTPI